MLTHSHWSLYIINVCACKYKIITNCCFNYWTLGFLPQKVLEQRDLTARSLELAAAIWTRENLVCSQHTLGAGILWFTHTQLGDLLQGFFKKIFYFNCFKIQCFKIKSSEKHWNMLLNVWSVIFHQHNSFKFLILMFKQVAKSSERWNECNRLEM